MVSEGTSFAQKGKSGKKKGEWDDKDFDKKKDSDGDNSKDPYAEMRCFKCNKKGHPARFCPNMKDYSDNSSMSSSKSKGSLAKQFEAIAIAGMAREQGRLRFF